jgi:hypothetical protein
MLHILKHGDDNFPSPAAGLLLGLDVKGILEITYIIPTPSASKPNEVNDHDSDDGHEDRPEVCYYNEPKQI